MCPVQGYVLNTNNPYREWPNAFAEGQEKAREGDLNAAVLLLEAAILQDPQDSEVILRWSGLLRVGPDQTIIGTTSKA